MLAGAGYQKIGRNNMPYTPTTGLKSSLFCPFVVSALFILLYIGLGSVYLWAARPTFSNLIHSVETRDILRRASSLSSKIDVSRKKLILYWGSSMPNTCDYFRLIKPDPTFEDLNCPVNNCAWTEDKTKIKEADAVLFIDYCLSEPPPQGRNPRGRWVYVCHESPCNSLWSLHKWNGLFNWTMTYTKESDIYSPYARLVHNERGSSVSVLSKERSLLIAKKKSKLVAWMASHCPTSSRREEYVEQLQKYIPVDVYGKCGPLVCERNDTRCSELLNNDYKFYLAFENGLSKDYVTEKFFNMIPLNVIPITRSGANFSRLGIPAVLHLDTRDFKSPKDLAEYLKRLDQDDESYAALLRAKVKYRNQIVQPWNSYCDLCKKMNDPNEPRKSYSAEEIRKQHGPCLLPNDL
ncbi:alpha-(1,3)-fucosyltransferase C [Lingula anatina]|uniref:Fucosyltransferase n=1 Tax=Lingula anatina TaxID=7574 RepID=A0A1S3HH35_LINAN|nr:alpha-(1,3)-fucosyltransferase C [Lingula anatina]|eukprot:XP_013385385.1 alpha-(1,3)-fucosyltransferase C [Lingula anatina]